jgi:hypothetical protein
MGNVDRILMPHPKSEFYFDNTYKLCNAQYGKKGPSIASTFLNIIFSCER